MPGLQKNYIRVQRGDSLSYGGNQMLSPSHTIQKCGCGPVAALDTLLYLRGKQAAPLSPEDYNRELSRLCPHYFPLLPPFGINGVLLAAGMNRLLRRYALPYRAFWAVSGVKFWDRAAQMLEQDLPVIFSIGPNFPAFWQKNKLTLYRKSLDGTRYIPAVSTIAHYITATELDRNWLRISSWGKEYYISRQEYDRYVREHSAAFVSNLLMLKKIR